MHKHKIGETLLFSVQLKNGSKTGKTGVGKQVPIHLQKRLFPNSPATTDQERCYMLETRLECCHSHTNPQDLPRGTSRASGLVPCDGLVS